MGMYDYVTVDPVHGLPKVEFQTKDFDCELTTVRVTEAGRLEIERFEYETVPKEERPYPDDDGFLGLAGSLRKVNRHWEDLNYHGMVNFYGHSEPGFSGDWLEYDAKFTDGNLVSIKPATLDPQPKQR